MIAVAKYYTFLAAPTPGSEGVRIMSGMALLVGSASKTGIPIILMNAVSSISAV